MMIFMLKKTLPLTKPLSTGKKFFAFLGPGMLVSVGYMDPGNWATDLAGGAQFGYGLLSVIFISNLMAMLLQHLSLKLGIASGYDLAQACRAYFSKPVNFILWLLCEVAIAACDLAEVLGSAVALNLLFHLPLSVGVILTSLDVLIILALSQTRLRYLEIFVTSLVFLIAGCFVYELYYSKPEVNLILHGLIPSSLIFTQKEMLYLGIGILGATVMPHNLYLHSSLVKTRGAESTHEGKKQAILFASIDSTLSLLFALFINAAILILAASAFHGTQYDHVADISDAYHLLTPILGAPWASTLFGVALLAAGQNATITGTMAGQIVMEGFLEIKLKPWVRRLLTRMVAIVPAMIVAIYWGETGVGELLVFSQIVLSMQLSFAVIPLVFFTGKKEFMGGHTNSLPLKILSWAVAIFIAGLNLYLLTFFIG
jgi:manganese transport protein